MASWKDTANPFNRLVTSVTNDDNVPNVPYFQAEKVKEATYQSDYGCESVYKALMYRLEHGTPVVQHKCLFLIRTIMLEGPSSFNAKMSSGMGKVNSLANSEVKKGSIEEAVKQLSSAIQQAVNGDSKALTRVASQGTAPASTDHSKAALKSEFQLQQERDMKAFKKKQGKPGQVILSEKMLEQFDPTLPPKKFVAAALGSTKKKFSPEELAGFAAAASETTSVTEVASALDGALKDGASPLATRYKALSFIDGMLSSDESHTEAQAYFQSHLVGVQRHLTLERSDNPAKSQLTQQLAQSLLTRIQSTQAARVPPPMAQSTPTQQQVMQPAPTQALQPATDPFAGMTFSSRQPGNTTQQSTNGATKFVDAWGGGDSSWGDSGNGATAPPQQQQWGPPAGSTFAPAQGPPMHQAPPPQAPSLQFQPVSQPSQPAPVATPPPVPAVQAQSQGGNLEQQMIEFQRNMQMMVNMMQPQPQQPPQPQHQLQPQQQPQPTHQQPAAQPQQPTWGSTATAPPPIPDPSTRSASQHSTYNEGNSIAKSESIDRLTPQALPLAPPAFAPVQYRAPTPPQAQAEVAPPQPPPPPPQPQRPAVDNSMLIQQVQQQIQETSKILAQQQQMLAMLLQQQSVSQ